MADMATRSGHTFHIPVMGTGFTIDTPLRVAKYGITSVISLVDDVLIEQMRKLHCRRAEEPCEEIGVSLSVCSGLLVTREIGNWLLKYERRKRYLR